MRIMVNDVVYRKGNAELLHGVTCAFQTGITYLVGKNGAGKSTLLKLAATAISPSEGRIHYTQLIHDEKTGMYRRQLSVEEVRKKVGFMPQRFTGYPDMSVERYLRYIAFHKGIPHKLVKACVNDWLRDADVMALKRRKLKTLSGGQLQKVGLIQALINQPRICILDEPYESLDAQEKLFFKRVIRRLSFHSVIIISTHLVEDIERADDVHILFIEEGQLLSYAEVQELEQYWNM